MVTIVVDGIPAPQGSKIRTRHGMFEASKRVKPWREAVAAAAGRVAPLVPPYFVEAWFYIPKPKSTKAVHPVAPAIGDLDKIVRATLDGLVQGGVLLDDRHVIRLHAKKEWADAGPGAFIVVTGATA